MDALQKLVGSVIEIVEVVQDYLQLTFSDGTILNIYNKYIFAEGSVLIIKGKKLASVSDLNNKIIFEIENCGELEVGLLDEDYNGPEAIEMIRKGESTIVWQ